MLLDLRRFFDLWVEHYARIPEQYRRLLPLKPVYFLALAQ
jgi:restriction system protein